jgi:hypothetical protein
MISGVQSNIFWLADSYVHDPLETVTLKLPAAVGVLVLVDTSGRIVPS